MGFNKKNKKIQNYENKNRDESPKQASCSSQVVAAVVLLQLQ
jgi:hypothetical protein